MTGQCHKCIDAIVKDIIHWVDGAWMPANDGLLHFSNRGETGCGISLKSEKNDL